jgi:uncharacterized protein (DUF1015 family)
MLIKPFKAYLPQLKAIAKTKGFAWEDVKENFPELLKKGFYQEAATFSLFLYEIETNGLKQQGLVGLIEAEAWEKGNLVPHEQTIATQVVKQKVLMIERNNAIKPILVTHPSHSAIKLALLRVKTANPPILTIKMNENETHTIYEISSNAMLDAVIQAYQRFVPKLYIADGHHRLAANLDLIKENEGKGDVGPRGIFVMMMGDDQVQIHDYSRWVTGMNGLTKKEFLEQIKPFCYIEQLSHADKPDFPMGMTLMLGKKWYSLFWRPSFLVSHFAGQPRLVLSAQLLNEYILGPILGITDVRTDKRLEYIDGRQGTAAIEALAKERDKGMGFCMYPIDISEVYQAGREGITLPPKSTWFEPRVLNGVLIDKW